MVIEPRVLLLDEPLSNLDASLREEMRFEIRRLHDQFHFTTVYVTHDQGEAMVTSDRIAVMNGGRIEQIDTPFHIYTRPRTRFVASFIGRTNLLAGTCDGDQVLFDHFALPRRAFPADLSPGQALFSVRPQSIRLHRTPGQGDTIQAAVVERAFLGETWDYLVSPAESGLRLKVSAPPQQVFAVGDPAWLEFDPAQMAPIAE